MASTTDLNQIMYLFGNFLNGVGDLVVKNNAVYYYKYYSFILLENNINTEKNLINFCEILAVVDSYDFLYTVRAPL